MGTVKWYFIRCLLNDTVPEKAIAPAILANGHKWLAIIDLRLLHKTFLIITSYIWLVHTAPTRNIDFDSFGLFFTFLYKNH